MTVEEKAEEYAKNLRADFKVECEIAYKDGYEQGQKDSNTFKSFKDGYENCALECAKDIEVLTKENEQLKLGNQSLEHQIEFLTEEIAKLHKCSRCMSNGKDINEYPCKNCLKDGVYTNWH